MSIFYRSLRVGKNGKLFYMYKFRTMIEGADRLGPPSTAADDPRLTKIGKFLRKYKLDELPQIINIIRGEMALIGPRPTVPEVIDTLSEDEKNIILSIRPGLTDLASLWDSDEEERLRGAINPHQTFMTEIYPEIKRLQIYYIQHRSFGLNVWILLQTIKKLLVR